MGGASSHPSQLPISAATSAATKLEVVFVEEFSFRSNQALQPTIETS